ncbi:DUF6223 family protein [Amycolatopsis benzoatilytica]|uniref:DUF6223 family protein n=1 Tax=Amycolatopsis benzoatilytica TaxID=346045 RepID=UPI000382BE35|nr:DUF6223 family protein [Amycolatopsis benzoatilytica]
MPAAFGPAAPAAAHVLAQAADPVSYGFTPARLWASAAALLALAGAVIGGLALSRSRRRLGNGGRRGAVVALSAGLVAVLGGVLSLAVADGGPGTGNGVVGAGAAVVLGLAAIGLGAPALVRSRRTAG